MGSSFHTQALILRTTDEREADRLVIVLTPAHGKQHVRARGTKKGTSKLAGSLQPVTEVQLSLANGRAVDVVTGSVIVQRWPKLRQDLVGFVSAQWLMELVERVTKPSQPEQGLYPLVTDMLHQMETELDWTPGRRWNRLLRRAWQVLEHEGFIPSWERCGVCHKPFEEGAWKFESLHGWVHHDEAAKAALQISPATIQFIKDGKTVEDSRTIFRDLHRLVQMVIEQTLERPLRSERVLKQVMI